MTSEVHKCFHEHRRNWAVLPTRRLLLAAIVVCLAVCPAPAPILRAAPQQAPSGSNSAPVSGAPVKLSLFDRLALQPARIQIPAYVCVFLALEVFPATGPVPFIYFQF
jgi:hypothetical protein